MKVTTDSRPRRPLKTRQARWPRVIAGWLQRRGIHPNHVSLLSVVFAVMAGAAFILAGRVADVWGALLLLGAAGLVQLRLLCNLLDGLMAVEGGLQTPSGEIFNDFPDRISDAVVLVAAGYYAAWLPWGEVLGWAAALLALITAYVRVLGGSAGATQYFTGPMAKQHRMALVTVACLASAGEIALGWDARAMPVALALVAAGCVVTILRRTRLVIRELESKT